MTEQTQVAKKKSASKSKKPAAGSKATSKKKTTAKPARTKSAAVKKASTKKAVAKKAPVKKAATKKAAPKKAATKKATAGKSPVKKAAPSKAPAKKSTAKKAPANKAAPKKPAAKASKPATAAKKAPAKKATIKKAPTKSGSKGASKAKKKTAGSGKPKKKPAPKAKDERYTLSEARAAASGLAARAGIKIVRSHTSAEPEEKTKTRQLRKSPLSKAQLEKYREILLLKRSEVAGDVSAMESEAFGSSDGGSFPQRQADQGSDEYEQALSLGLAETQRRLLVQINEALARIDEGVYGICALTGGPIGRDRLDATPWTKLSLEGAREQDRQNYYQ